MRGYDRAVVYRRLLDLLERSGGMTGSAISAELGISRLTMSKYLDAFAAEGLIRPSAVGNSRVWSPAGNAASFEFPGDYARASGMFSEAVAGLDAARAGSIIGSCMGSGAEAVRVLSEILVPAIELARDTYESGKVGSAEMAGMRRIISGSIGRLRERGEHRRQDSMITMATDAHSALHAEAAAAVLAYGGWAVTDLGDVYPSSGPVFDTEIEKLLVRVRAPPGAITAVVVFSSVKERLQAVGTSADAARQGAVRGVHLALCGPGEHAVRTATIMTRTADAVHWAESL